MSVIKLPASSGPATPIRLGGVYALTDANNQNVALGYNALVNVTDVRNVAIGDNALGSATGARNSVVIGDDGLENLINGVSNVAIGHQTGVGVNYLDRTVLVGTLTGTGNQTYQNVHVGNNSQSQGGNNNTTLGYAAMVLDSYSNNIVIGANAVSSDTGDNEITLGDWNISRFRIPGLGIDWTANPIRENRNSASISIGQSNQNLAYSENIGIGLNTLTSIYGGWNTAIGAGALSNAQGLNNTVAIGKSAGSAIQGGNDNVFVGREIKAYNAETDTNSNVMVGAYVNQQGSGSYNTMLGAYSGVQATGDSNVFIGYQSGYSETGSNKLYISNSLTSTPLIYGDFSQNSLTVNGTLTVTGGILGGLDMTMLIMGAY